MTYRKSIVVMAAMVLTVAGCGDATASTTTTTEASPTTTTVATTTTAKAVGVSSGDTVEGFVGLGQFPAPISFTTSDSWDVPFAEPEGVVLADPVTEAPFTRALLFLIATPTGGHESIGDQVAQGSQFEQVTIIEQAETTVGGFDATVYDLTYDGPGELDFLITQGFGGSIILRNTEYYRVWEVDNGERLVLFAPVLRGDLEWFNKAEALIDTIEFG